MKILILFALFVLAAFNAASESSSPPVEPAQKMSPAEVEKMMHLIVQLHLGQNTPAWKAAVGEEMLKEANFFSDRLHLPTARPIRWDDVKLFYCSPPFFARLNINNPATTLALINSGFRSATFGPMGALSTTNFTFYFNRCHLWVVENRVIHEERFDLYSKWAKTPSLIDTNSAYQLATQWLAAIDVDVAALNQTYPHKVVQRFFWNKPGKDYMHPPPDIPANKTMLPVFIVTWGPLWPHRKYSDNAVRVAILGTTKELMNLRLDMVGTGGRPSFSCRPLLVITNALELCNPSNTPLKHLEFPPPWPTNSPPATNRPAAKPPPVRRENKTP